MTLDIVCLAWGHRLRPIPLSVDLGSIAVCCARCEDILGIFTPHSRIPSRFRRRGDQLVTLGPVRRVYEHASCWALGHEEDWVLAEEIMAERTLCRCCGEYGRLVREPQ